jgi:hypothetical protein
MGLFVAAWIAAEGIVVYRWKKLGAPPTPGALLWPSVIFVGLAVLAERPVARGLATAAAVAVDLAVLTQVLGKTPSGTTGWPPAVMDNATTAVFPSGPSSQQSGGTAS